jgi:hypothetical protein
MHEDLALIPRITKGRKEKRHRLNRIEVGEEKKGKMNEF